MKILDNISGYKTIFGGVLHALWFIYYMFIEKNIDTEMQWRGHGIIGILTGVGLGHKAYKNKDKIINTVNKIRNGRKSI